MSSEYYTLEKVAEVLELPTAEVNRLREKNELRAYRDGTSWKFRKDQVDDMIAAKIKNRNKQQNNTNDDLTIAGTNGNNDDDFDLLVGDEFVELPEETGLDTKAFDAAMEDGLELEEELIDAPIANIDNTKKTNSKNQTAPEILTTKDNAILSDKDDDDIFSLATDDDDDLVLADDQPEIITPQTTTSNGLDAKKTDDDDDELIFASDELSLAEDDGLTLDESSTLILDNNQAAGGVSLSLDKNGDKSAAAKKNAKIAIDDELDDDLLKSFSDDSNISEAAPSGFSLAADDVFELEDNEDNNTNNTTATTAKPAKSAKPALDDNKVVFEDDDGFLELLSEEGPTDVISDEISTGDEFQLTPDGFIGGEESESTSQLIPLDPNNTFDTAAFGGGLDGAANDFGATPATDNDFSSLQHQTHSNVTYQQEVQYSPFIVGSFIAAAVLLILPCVMLLDVIANIWGWNESIPINSPIMNLIVDNFLGLRK
ncbi:MAG: helix-turn-helix domain-containing protein [Planctomycetaceae bacterium]|jgi:excisionase family DNA binding protein|nr:helix-turn-helix domain-containing protein [Planctomycetaceae bacterium]